MAISKKVRPWFRIAIDEARSRDRVERCKRLLDEVKSIMPKYGNDSGKMARIRAMQNDLLDAEAEALSNQIKYKKEQCDSAGRIEYT